MKSGAHLDHACRAGGDAPAFVKLLKNGELRSLLTFLGNPSPPSGKEAGLIHGHAMVEAAARYRTKGKGNNL